ncbi:hypothetical protein [Streptococcus parasanguinis]|uniref:hypothetical protein n=1 Tax=Streptococcus parasanguinis TaxID=1318 RepID=UPI00288C3A8E|nr:hypothetical protein [Streptococcus parasanguinis]
MKRLTDILLLPLSIVTLIGCSKNNNQSLDGEYHWLSCERNELAFTIKSDEGPIKNGEVDSFNINKKKHNRINWTKYCKSNRKLFL